MADVIQDMVKRMSSVQKKLDAELAGVSDEVFYGVPKEGDWAISEIMGHIVELQWYWMNKVKVILKENNPKLVRTPGETTSRLAIPAAFKGYTRDIIVKMVKHANQDSLEDISKLPPGQFNRTGTRGDGKVVNVPQQVELIAKHYEEHINQIAANKLALAKK